MATKEKSPETPVQAAVFGTQIDPTPNENYTVAGVTSGKPTPETDAKTAATAAESAATRSRFR